VTVSSLGSGDTPDWAADKPEYRRRG